MWQSETNPKDWGHQWKARVTQKLNQESIIFGKCRTTSMDGHHPLFLPFMEKFWVSGISSSKVHILPYKPNSIYDFLQWHNYLFVVSIVLQALLSFLIVFNFNLRKKKKKYCWVADTARSYYFLKMKGNFILKLIVAFTPKLLKCVEGGGGEIIFVAS